MLKIFPIGGIDGVTKNMFVYELDNDLIVVDCGIGFPDETMLGVDFLIPDTQYLAQRLAVGAKLHAIFLTHGHDDHIAALPHVLRELNLVDQVPIYASPLTAEFAMDRLRDHGIETTINYFDQGQQKAGPFTVETVFVTHSIPDTRHLAIHTPEGIIYHGSDFKLDLTPVDGRATDYQHIAALGRQGVLCALIDCLRIERPLPTPSESSIADGLRREFRDIEGKILVTLMSSSIHRIQQVIDVAAEFGRKVAFIGRSVEQNVSASYELQMLDIDERMVVDKRDLAAVPDHELVIIIAGSQGQPGSSLVRAVFGSHQYVTLQKGDKVIFSADAIPGSERFVYHTINEIAKSGIEVVYSDLDDGLHVSGHASEYEQMTLVHLLTPKYVFPIGGEERHRVLFGLKVRPHGYRPSEVVLPMQGKIVEFQGGKMHYSAEQIKLRERSVDSSGIANVIAEHMHERQLLGNNGALVIRLGAAGGNNEDKISLDAVGLDVTGLDVTGLDAVGLDVIGQQIQIETRGVSLGHDISHEDLAAEIKRIVVEQLADGGAAASGGGRGHGAPPRELRQKIERAVIKRLNKMLGGAPLVIVV